MPWSDYLALLAFLAALSFTPGPNTMLCTAIAANRGLRPALAFASSVPVGWCLLLLACTLGLGGLLQAEPTARALVKWSGLAYMLWLAWRLAGSRQLSEANPTRLNLAWWQGAALQWVNIKAWMAALVVASQWVAGDEAEQRLHWVLPTMMAFAFASNASYGLLGASLRPWLQQGQRLLAFNRAMASLLLLTCLWMAWST